MNTTLPPPAVPAAGGPPRLKSVVTGGEAVGVPGWVVDLESFRRWTVSAEFPSHGRIDWLDGDLWVDMSREEFFGHNQVQTEITVVLGMLARTANTGRFVADRMRLVHPPTRLSCEPDAAYFSWEAVRTGRVSYVRAANESAMELLGTPDMVLEVVSPSSVRKDTIEPPVNYAAAQVPEFWLVDVRGEQLRFDVLILGEGGYAQDLTADGWSRSRVFGREFLLRCDKDPFGQPKFALADR
jgi:Uma2 family endonuclease